MCYMCGDGRECFMEEGFIINVIDRIIYGSGSFLDF